MNAHAAHPALGWISGAYQSSSGITVPLCWFDPPQAGGDPALINKTRIVPKRIE